MHRKRSRALAAAAALVAVVSLPAPAFAVTLPASAPVSVSVPAARPPTAATAARPWLAARPSPAAAGTWSLAPLPRPDHVLILMLENKGYRKVIGSARAPYLNALATSGANFTAAMAEGHPSQPNYLALFSGGTDGVSDDHCPVDLGAVPNLGSQLFAAHLSFTGYAEDVPSGGFSGCAAGSLYRRKHVPWMNFANLPATARRTGARFPWHHLDRLPTVAWYAPNMCHSMHDCNLPTGDKWLSTALPGYVRWAGTHNSLLIVTFDEAGRGGPNQIPTIFVGPMVRAADTAQPISHYSILRTIEDMYGLAPLGKAAEVAPITGIWR